MRVRLAGINHLMPFWVGPAVERIYTALTVGQTFTVPAGVLFIQAEAFGAGGGAPDRGGADGSGGGDQASGGGDSVYGGAGRAGSTKGSVGLSTNGGVANFQHGGGGGGRRAMFTSGPLSTFAPLGL